MAEATIGAAQFDPSSVSLGQNFLLVGTEAYLIDQVLDGLKSTLRKKGELDVINVWGDEVKAAALNDTLDTLTIFSTAKLVIIKVAEKLLKKELEVLAAYFDDPSDIQSVVVVTEKTDIRFSAWKKISAHAQRINCDPPRYSSDIKNWLVRELQRQNLRMDAVGQQEFIDRIELDYYWAANELAKLSILAGESRSISSRQVLSSLNTSRSGTISDFYRSLGRRDPKSTLASIEKMLAVDWEPLQVFFQIHKFYTIIWKILLLKAKHITESEISAKHLMDLFTNQRKEFVDFSRGYTLRSIERIMAILLETDAKLKTTTASDILILETCAITILEA